MRTPTFSEFTQQNDKNRNDVVQPIIDVNSTNPQMMPMPMQSDPQGLTPRQHGENPFALQKYNSVMVPDAPLQFGGGLTESLLNDNEVPEETKRKYWWVFHKDNTLTFLDEDRKRNKLLSFDIAKIDILNTMPYYDYTFEKELDFTVLRNVFETKLDRAFGFKGTAQKNERIVLQSQFQENRQINDSEGQIKEGFFKRLLGRR
jgi:hypothetical protein